VTSLAMLGLLPPENSIVDPASEIILGGRNLVGLPLGELRKLRGAEISMIFQEPMTSLNPGVHRRAGSSRKCCASTSGMTGRAARKRAVELLREVGIPEPERRIDAYPSQLSAASSSA
jgi:peptide/nickel transport system ATP-binding protein